MVAPCVAPLLFRQFPLSIVTPATLRHPDRQHVAVRLRLLLLTTIMLQEDPSLPGVGRLILIGHLESSLHPRRPKGTWFLRGRRVTGIVEW